MERSFFDWKFFVTLAATVAGVIVPVYLWQLDLSSKALTVRLVSSISVINDPGDPGLGLQLTIEGANVEAPYLSTFEVINSGSRAILSSDFESSMEIDAGKDISVVRAKVASTIPGDIQATVSALGQQVKIQPLLLNPGDALTIGVITAGGAPFFVPRARVAGIARVAYEDQTKRQPRWRSAAIYFVLAALAAPLYFYLTIFAISPRRLTLNRWAAMATMLVCAAAGSGWISRAFLLANVERTAVMNAALATGLVLIAVLFYPRAFYGRRVEMITQPRPEDDA
jgi:hypothetical protein